MENSGKIKAIIRIAALALIILFFVPMMSVSCGLIEIEFSLYDIATANLNDIVAEETGMGFGAGFEEMEPVPAFFIFILLALVILIFANKARILSSICAILSAIGLYGVSYIIEEEVKREASVEGYSYASVETTTWFTVYMIICIGIVVLLAYERSIINDEKKNASQNATMGYAPSYAPPPPPPPPQQMQFTYCSKCGHREPTGVRFCSHCGGEIQPAQSKTMFCSKCGNKYSEGEMFCSRCGNNLK